MVFHTKTGLCIFAKKILQGLNSSIVLSCIGISADTECHLINCRIGIHLRKCSHNISSGKFLLYHPIILSTSESVSWFIAQESEHALCIGIISSVRHIGIQLTYKLVVRRLFHIPVGINNRKRECHRKYILFRVCLRIWCKTIVVRGLYVFKYIRNLSASELTCFRVWI